MVMRNHSFSFRPLMGGVAIVCGSVNRYGTLGCIATSDGTDRWILTAGHVFAPAVGEVVTDGDPVFQSVGPGTQVARVRLARSDAALDVAAAEIEESVDCVGEVLGIGQIRGACPPVVGMRVLKSGAATGVTQGRIESLDGDRVVIVPRDGTPSKYELSDASDSGSVWLDEETHKVVALHQAGYDFGTEQAEALAIERVLDALQLELLIE